MYKKILSIIMLLYAAGTQSMNLLHQSIKHDRLSDVKQILNEEHGLLESLNSIGETPLLYAANSNRKSIAEYLVVAGANPNASRLGLTPLHFAAMRKNSHLAYLLIRAGALLNPLVHDNRFTPLHYAARYDAREVAMHLCEEGADVTIKNNFEMTPLEVACDEGSFQSFSILLTYDSNRSLRLLSLAVKQRYPLLVAALLYNGIKANSLNAEIREKIIALLDIHYTYSYPILRAILTLPSEDFLNDFRSKNYHDENALEFAYAQGMLEHAAEIEKRMQQAHIPVLESHRKILISAVSRGDLEVCRMFLDKLPKSECIEKHSFLLNLALKLAHRDIATLLLHHQDFKPTLKNAVISRHSAAIEALLNAGASTTEAEDFLNDPAHENESKIHKEFYAALHVRLTEHKETLHNPPQTSYLFLLCKDIRVFILHPMTKTRCPQQLLPSHSL